MQKDTGENKAREVILKAINALQERGSDVNAYSVADQAGIPRALLIHNASLMRLVAEARGETTSANGESYEDNQSTEGTEELPRPSERDQIDNLKREVEQALWENKVLRKYFQDTQAENQKLRDELQRLQQEAQNIAHSVQIAWQQGYLAGQQSDVQEQPTKSLVQSLKEAAAAATTHGAMSEVSEPVYQAAVGTAEGTSLSDLAGEDEEEPYVADVELKIEDPEVLNDPFTAKLINALQGEGENVDLSHIQPVYEDISANFTVSPQDSLTGQIEYSAATGTFEEGTAKETTDQFTAEELHNLFRNRYVRSDEQPEAPKPAVQEPAAPPQPQTTKKFVGAKHTSAEPLPMVARVVPPDIRKACKLLGVNPETDLSRAIVLEAWKKEMSKPGVHPDTGGDTEMAIYLNTAKDTLMRWVEAQTPKLGKKFGQQAKPDATKPQPKSE